MEYEIMITKEYKNTKSWINRIEKELKNAGIEDYLDTIPTFYYSSYKNGSTKRYNEKELCIREIIKIEDYCEDYRDNDMSINLDFRYKEFIYIYTEIK